MSLASPALGAPGDAAFLAAPPAGEPAVDDRQPEFETDSGAAEDPVPSDPDTGEHAVAAASRHRADPGAAARMFDAATTRRRSVVFEEDDELDVPDFLK